MRYGQKKYKGFSLVEMLASATVLGMAVVVICTIGSKGISGMQRNREYELAYDLADRQLTLIDYMGIDEFLELRQMSGQFNDDEGGGVVYSWQAAVDEGPLDNIYLVSVTVSWIQESGGRSVSVVTILNGEEAAETSEESEQQENATVSM